MKAALLTVVVLAACSEKLPDPAKYDYETIVLKKPEGSGSGSVRTDIPETTRQLITGVIDDWSATRATLRLWTRADAASPWAAVGASWDAVIGREGAAWGVGLHAPHLVPTKVEGDGKAPAGLFRLRGSYGYTQAPPEGSKLTYAQSNNLVCVDDSASAHYASIVDGTRVKKDWKSFEEMRGAHDQYTWVIDIAHNPEHVATRGSCIFFHVWGAPGAPTEGCTAMAEPRLVEMLKQLDPAAEPIYVLLPRAEYTTLREAWGLPPL